MDTPLPDLTSSVSDQFARMCELYGVSPTLGRLYAVLFTSTRPVALDELATELGVARSTTSVAMRRLVEFGMVERLPPRPDRRDWYVAVLDPDEILRRWSERYFTPELVLWRSVLDDAGRALAAPNGEPLRARFERLGAFVVRWETLLAAMQPDAARAPAVRIPVEFEP